MKNSYFEIKGIIQGVVKLYKIQMILVIIIICCNKRMLQDILPFGEVHAVANTISQQTENSSRTFVFKKGKKERTSTQVVLDKLNKTMLRS